MKKQFKNLFKAVFFSTAIFSAFFFITEFEAYRPKIMPFVGSMAEPFREKGVHIQAKAYNSHDSQAYLSRDLLEQGFQPVQVTVQNNTAQGYFLSKKGVEAPHATTGEVTSHVIRSAIPRSIAFKVAGFFFWPLIIPGTIDSIMTFKNHSSLKKDYSAKSIKEEGEYIAPYSTMHRVLFIPQKDYSDTFTLHLQEQKTGHFSPFEVKINS